MQHNILSTDIAHHLRIMKDLEVMAKGEFKWLYVSCELGRVDFHPAVCGNLVRVFKVLGTA